MYKVWSLNNEDIYKIVWFTNKFNSNPVAAPYGNLRLLTGFASHVGGARWGIDRCGCPVALPWWSVGKIKASSSEATLSSSCCWEYAKHGP